MNKEEMYNRYIDLILKWKDSSDLTAAKDCDEIRQKHIDDSISVIPYLGKARSVIDLGTGAGLPGIPIKIERPDLKITLLDSRRKKINFLKQVVLELRLNDIDAVQGRAEDEAIIKKLGRFDVVISRATWELSEYLKVAVNYLGKNGICIAMKGSRWEEELKAAEPWISKLGIKLIEKKYYTLSKGEERTLFIFSA